MRRADLPGMRRPAHIRFQALQPHRQSSLSALRLCLSTPDYTVSRIDFGNNTAKVAEGGSLYDYRLNSTLIYNVYNIIAVIAVLRQLGYEHEVIAGTLERVHIVQSRFRQDVIRGKTLSVIMAKGLNAVA